MGPKISCRGRVRGDERDTAEFPGRPQVLHRAYFSKGTGMNYVREARANTFVRRLIAALVGMMRAVLDLVRREIARLRQDRLAPWGALILSGLVILAVVGPLIAPYDPWEPQYGQYGALRLTPPSAQHWLGTDSNARDILSQVLIGARVAVGMSVLAALLIAFVGTLVGLTAGYLGGKTDMILMRITDAAFVIPSIPFVAVLVALTLPSLLNIIFAIAFLYWRSAARVVRGQVLSLKERPFIKAARACGASDYRIMVKHILPNVLPIVTFYAAVGVQAAVITEASLSFLGFGDPSVISWGKMLQYGFAIGATRAAWWWLFPPGFMISLLVVSVYMLRRGYEDVVNPRLKRRE